MHIESGIDQQLAMLQFSDSFFPGGATSFSWGLESLRLDGQVGNVEQLFGLLQAQVTHRWAGLDRPLMHLAHQACTDCGDSPALMEAISAVIDVYGRSERNKYRAVVYYLLVKHFGKDAIYA